MCYTKNCFLVICLFVVLSCCSSAADNEKIKVVKNSRGEISEFSYIIPGKALGNGKYSMDKIVKIHRHPISEYFGKTVYIKVKPEAQTKDEKTLASSGINQVLSKLNATIKKVFHSNKDNKLLSAEEYELSRVYEVKYNADVHPFDACFDLVKCGDVIYACPSIFNKVCANDTVNDPKVGSQWAISELNMKEAWKISKGNKKVRIGVVDSGVNWYHEDLADNIWSNPNDTLDGIDNDNNGKIDDIRGWDFIGNATMADIQQGNVYPDNDPDNLNYTHGTLVSGIASAVTNNGKGIAGIGYGCTIIPVKCGMDKGSENLICTYLGMQYIGDLKADILNCSFGAVDFDSYEEDEINYCLSQGVLVVAGTGNNGVNIDEQPFYPACFSGVLSVGATEQGAKVASYSNYGYPTTIYAPGTNILSTSPNNNYEAESGTSLATPIVAGVAGLIKSLHPTWTNKQIYHQIRGTAKNNLTSDPEKRPLYFGMIDPVAALTINNGNNETMPGIEMSDFALESVSSLSDNNKHKMSFNIKNYLSDSKNLTVTITPLDDFIQIESSSFNIGVLKTNEQKELTSNIQLTSMVPWSEGYAKILLTYTDGKYINYEVAKIPVELTGNNTFNTIETTNNLDYSLLTMQQYTPASYDNSNYLCFGYAKDYGLILDYNTNSSAVCNIGTYLMNSNNGSFKFNKATVNSSPITAACIVNPDLYFYGNSPVSKKALVYKSTDAGTTWKLCQISNTISPAYKNIHFFTDSIGVCIGDPANNIWGIAVTNNQGINWVKTAQQLSAEDGETCYNSSFSWYGDFGWFGSSKGKVFMTSDRGQTWNSVSIPEASDVVFTAFSDGMRGAAVYKKDTLNVYYVAQTTDGGKSWHNTDYVFKPIGCLPIAMSGFDGSNQIIMAFNDNRVLITDDYGKTWKPILTQRHSSTQAAVVYANKSQGQAYITGFNQACATQLIFNYLAADTVKHLDFTGNDTLYFPDTKIGSTSTIDLAVRNNGNSLVTCNDFDISAVKSDNINEFTTVSNSKLTVDGGKSQSIHINFTPQSLGDKVYKLQIKSDAVNSPNTVILKGKGSNQTGIENTIEGFDCSIVPNPCSNTADLNINNGIEGNYKIDLYDLNGVKIMNVFSGYLNQGLYNFKIDACNLSSGQYFLEINKDMTKLVKRVMVVK